MYRHYLHDVFSFHIKRCLYNVHSNSCWWSGPKSIPRPNHCKKKKLKCIHHKINRVHLINEYEYHQHGNGKTRRSILSYVYF